MTQDAHLLIDGYNVINSWPEFGRLKADDLGHARDRLTDMLAGYSAFKGCRATLVFDAYAVAGDVTEDRQPGITVVFTGEGETADSYIEKAAYDLARRGEKVFVVTGDANEQMTALGVGAYRITARELFDDCRRVGQAIDEQFTVGRLTPRREVAGRLTPAVAGKLEDLRRARPGQGCCLTQIGPAGIIVQKS